VTQEPAALPKKKKKKKKKIYFMPKTPVNPKIKVKVEIKSI
jgi:hypothetical protein